jgi:proteasome-associated ATPase
MTQPELPVGEAVEVRSESARLRAALARAQQTQGELRALVEQLTDPPWHPALFQRGIETPRGRRALVWIGGQPRVVNLHPDLDAASLRCGDPVYLDQAQANVLAAAGEAFAPPLDTASFVRFAAHDRLVVRCRDDELVLESAARFDAVALRAGHLVLFDRASRIAMDRLESSAGRQYLFEDAADLALDAVGGHRRALEDLLLALTASLLQPLLARAYGLGGRRAVLLYGPPGCGKTLMARTAAAEIQRRGGRRCRFAVVRPGEFESPYVGESEANIRACFAALRESAGDALAVIFLDEIDSIGRVRGAMGARHADRSLTALLAELDGFAGRGEVAIVAATNRRDLLDPALHSRLADVEIAVGRPDRAAAREIFAIHLPASLPFAAPEGDAGVEPGSAASEALRAEVVEVAVSLLYAPNADNALCTIQLRDGSTREVRARDLASGRLFEQIALGARERAFRRHLQGGAAGVRSSDAADAVEDALARLATTLGVHNARAHLADLPDDVDVVRVAPVARRPARSGRYQHVA